MNDPSRLPMALSKANLDLQLGIANLVRNSGEHWLQFARHLVDEGIAESNTEVARLVQAGDWQKLATLPAETFWRLLQQHSGDSQEAASIAQSAQLEFARGLHEVLVAWQRATADAFAGAFADAQPPAQAGDNPWAPWLEAWQQALPAAFSDYLGAINPAAPRGRK